MSRTYRLTADVEAIADFIAGDSVDAAVKVVLAREDAFGLLASRPGIGHLRQDLTERPWSSGASTFTTSCTTPLEIRGPSSPCCTALATSPRSSRSSAEKESSNQPAASRPQELLTIATPGSVDRVRRWHRLQNVSTAAVDSCGLVWTALRGFEERNPR